MKAEEDIARHAAEYEALIKEKLNNAPLDLVMLGMGEDGHTASLFPHTEGLHLVNKLVTPNFIPQKNCWRMTFTFELINKARAIVLYAIGAEKAAIIDRVFSPPYNPDELPSQRIGTISNPAFFLLDEAASKNLCSHLK